MNQKGKSLAMLLSVLMSTSMASSSVLPVFAANENETERSTEVAVEKDNTDGDEALKNEGADNNLNTDGENQTSSKEEDQQKLQEALKKAQKEYDEAKKAYDEAPLQFIYSLLSEDELKEYNIENQFKLLQNVNPDEMFTTEAGEKISYKSLFTSGIEKKGELLKKQYTFDFLRKQADLLDECNKRILTDPTHKSVTGHYPMALYPTKILQAETAAMMVFANPSIHHSIVTYYNKTYGGLPDKDKDKYKYKIAWDTRYENSGALTGDCNPFEGWYDEEEYYFRTGDNQYPIPGKPGQTIRVDTVGHYKNIVRFSPYDREVGFVDDDNVVVRTVLTSVPTTGFGVFQDVTSSKPEADRFHTYIQEFGYTGGDTGALSGITGKNYTADEWRNMVNKCEAPLKEKLETAEKNLEEAKTAAGVKEDDKGNTGDNTGGNTGKDDTDKPSGGNTDKPSGDITVPVENCYIINEVKLSTTKYTYDGKVKKPSVAVYSDGRKMKSSGYKVSYSSGRKNIGTYTVTVTGIQANGCVGSARATFQIVPKGMKTPSVKAGKKKATVKWAKVSGSVRYQIAIAKKGGKYKYYAVSGSSKSIKKLSSKKKYTVKVRAYKKVGSKTYYGSWSKGKTVKVK